jgi:stage III sporulation protein AC
MVKTSLKKRRRLLKMDISLIMKIAGLGILVAVASQILGKTGRDEQATFVTVAGIITALFLLITKIRELFDLITSAFGI